MLLIITWEHVSITGRGYILGRCLRGRKINSGLQFQINLFVINV